MRPTSRTVEAVIAAIATRQHGVVTRTQLLSAGISSSAIQRRVRRRMLFVQHPGVYRVGHRAPSLEARYVAAVLACGDGAVLSGLAAAYLHGLVKGRVPPPEVTTPLDRRVRGVLTRRTRVDLVHDTTITRGIPAMTVPRTIVDLAARFGARRLARVCHEAAVLFGTTPREVDAVLARRPTTPGAARLRRVLHGDVHVTLSELERRFLVLLRDAGLVLPQTNRVASGRRVDCRWPDARLTVELDSYRFHRSRHAWELDRRREREAYARGDQFRRYTYGDVFERPETVLCELVPLLSGTAVAR